MEIKYDTSTPLRKVLALCAEERLKRIFTLTGEHITINLEKSQLSTSKLGKKFYHRIDCSLPIGSLIDIPKELQPTYLGKNHFLLYESDLANLLEYNGGLDSENFMLFILTDYD